MWKALNNYKLIGNVYGYKKNQKTDPTTATLFRFTMNCVLLVIAFLKFTLSEKLLKFYKTECSFNPKYIANGTCDLRVKSRSLVVTNAEVDLVIPVENLYVNAALYKYYSQFRPFLFNESAYFCELVDERFNSKLTYFGKTMYRIARKYTNGILCGHKVSNWNIFNSNKSLVKFQPGHYYIKDLTFYYDTFKFFLETGKYKVSVNFFERNGTDLESLGNYNLFLDVYMKYTRYPTPGKKEFHELPRKSSIDSL